MNLHFFSRIELLFWDFAIQMLSQSKLMRTFLRKGYQLANTSEITSLGILMGISGIVGLITGYMFYFMTTGLR
jgi:hypothetical protein